MTVNLLQYKKLECALALKDVKSSSEGGKVQEARLIKTWRWWRRRGEGWSWHGSGGAWGGGRLLDLDLKDSWQRNGRF